MNKRLFFLITAVLSALLFAAGHLRAQESPPWRFGVIQAYEAPNSARELDAGWTRITWQWAEVQADGPDSWTPPVSEEQIAAQITDGYEIIGLLIGIPDWARDGARLPAGLWLDHNDPGNLWANYVREATGRYAGRIDHWIIWNEPDIDATAVAHTWDGSVDDFYQLQRVAYLVAKETNPDAIIHLAAFTYWADANAGREQYMARLLARILADPAAAAHNHYFDVATAHLYFQAGSIYDLLFFFRGVLAAHDLQKPIWLVETNAPPFDDPAWPVSEVTLAVTENEQAAFMPQALAAALAAGAERIGVFKLRDTQSDRQANPEPFGLLRLDGSRRPAYATYQVALRQMRGVRHATRVRWDAVAQFELLQDDRRTTVLFARLPATQMAEVTAVAPSALLINMWGEGELIEARDGRYQIELQSALCTQTIGDYCMIGGTALYLVESLAGGPPPSEPAPILPPSDLVPTLPPTFTPTATATVPATPTPAATATPQPTAGATATTTAVPSATPQPTTATAATAPPGPEPPATRAAPAQSPADDSAAHMTGISVAGLLGLGFVVAYGLYRYRR